MVNVFLEPEAEEQVEELPKRMKARVKEVLVRLEEWPEWSGVKALKGNLAGKYRLRTGAYRLQFRLEGDRVVVEKVGHRSKFYED